MKRKKAGRKQQEPRNISMTIHLEGGHSHEIQLREDSPELASLFRVLASRGSALVEPAEEFFQLPIDHGRAACSFNSTQLVSVITNPPVVVQIEAVEAPPPPPQTSIQQALPALVQRPGHMVIDDFLSHDEHRDMLAYALANEKQFDAGTVTTSDAHYRQNLVIMNFHESAHSTLLRNRLLTWLPQMTQTLGMELFPLESVESQMTASNDGHYFSAHKDSGDGETLPRTLSCVYYFFREPRAFSGGALRLYDTLQQGDQSSLASSYKEIEPVSNRLVVFPSDAFHELMRIRCPSREFQDSRFAITNWIRRSESSDPGRAFGWGHMHCGIVPRDFALQGGSQ